MFDTFHTRGYDKLFYLVSLLLQNDFVLINLEPLLLNKHYKRNFKAVAKPVC